MHEVSTVTSLLSTAAALQPNCHEHAIVAPPHPGRWLFSYHREILGLAPYILPVPRADGPEGKKFQRIASSWFAAQSKIFDAEPGQALKIALQTSEKFFDRLAHRPKVKIQFMEDDLFDPGRKYDLALERSAHLLRDIDVDDVASALKNSAFLEILDRLSALAEDLLEFHDRHMTANDVRFPTVRALGHCLKSLVLVLRRAA